MKFWGMGSIILASSGVQQIKQRCPNAHVIFLTLRGNQKIVEALSICDEALYLEIDRGIITLLRDIVRLLYKLRKRKIDLVIDLEFFTNFSALVTYLISARVSGGFYDCLAWRGELHAIQVPFNRYWHTKKNFENLIARCINGPIEDCPVVKPVVASSEKTELWELLAGKGISGNDPLICLNANAGELALERRWPAKSFAELGNKLASLYPDYKFIFIGSKAESDYVSGICGVIEKKNVFNFAGQLSVGMLIGLLAQTRLLITNDSGPLHLAVALETPTVSFFGPETPVLYGPPQNGKHMVLYKNLDCSPCINVYDGKLIQCVRGKPDCLIDITVDDALRSVQRIGVLKITQNAHEKNPSAESTWKEDIHSRLLLQQSSAGGLPVSSC